MISKVQYKGFETGEFTEIANRNLEEIILLIKNYPWEQERHLTSVGLTGPSISIEDNEGNILKLGTGYNSHYKLYWLKASDRIYLHDVNNLDEAIHIITAYCNSKDISEGFRPYKSLSYKKHFITNDFVYTVTTKRILLNILGTNTMVDLLILFFIWMSYFIANPNPTPLIIKIILGLLWLLFSGIDYLYLIRYYLFSRNQYIQISKGINQFMFGTKTDFKQYYKTDILKVKRYEVDWKSYWKWKYYYKSGREPGRDKIVYEILMKDGEVLTFPNLLINSFTFGSKIPAINVEKIPSDLPKWL